MCSPSPPGEGRTASTILRHGAQHLLVFTLFDLGVLPWFETPAARGYVNDLSAAYNGALLEQQQVGLRPKP